ncbi:NAD(P)H-binding protein [Larkinella humicola]|uniref:NAD(P)H-binding protein n=1 Tax=Larkinella humicola TaxID=2607654 RepID=A0A5N1JE71_9BACT|nr:NAD(P)H-binding protein [Larkinella humicola]KAA9353666.1 NAD(P)H-binding protein [Larkinella humicola]
MSKGIENPAQKTLVLGGTGKTGSRIVQRLTERGWQVRIGSRSATPAFDWMDESTWGPVLRGVDAVYITFQPDLAVPGAVASIQSFVEMAVETGVQKLVLLSGRGEPEAEACEQIVIHSGVDWTILRASWFNQNFSESYLLEPILAGYVTLPVGHVGEPFIDVDDIAEVAVAALTENGHTGQLYELTGPRLLTFEEAVGEIARTIGRSIQYEPISMSAYAAMLKEYGIPEAFVALLTYLFTEVLDGRNASLADGVERALGRKPTDFAEYVRKTAITGVWNQ